MYKCMLLLGVPITMEHGTNQRSAFNHTFQARTERNLDLDLVLQVSYKLGMPFLLVAAPLQLLSSELLTLFPFVFSFFCALQIDGCRKLKLETLLLKKCELRSLTKGAHLSLASCSCQRLIRYVQFAC